MSSVFLATSNRIRAGVYAGTGDGLIETPRSISNSELLRHRAYLIDSRRSTADMTVGSVLITG